MRVMIDCFKLVKGSGKSIGIYNVALNLVRNFGGAKDNSIEYIVLGNQYNRNDFDIDGVDFVEVTGNPLNKVFCIYWELFAVTRYYKKYNADVILFPRGYTTMLSRMNDIIIVHDLIPFYYHEKYYGYFNKLENAYIMNRLKASIKKAKKIVTISEFSKQEIVNRIGIDEDRISVIYDGLNKIQVADERVEVLEIDGISLEDDYIIAITSSLPHKNAIGILKSYEQYLKSEVWNEKGNTQPLKLIILGIDSLEKYGFSDSVVKNIKCIKYIEEDKKLHQLIKSASIFLFLSEMEGFGFPPIEAMQLGTPVICSELSSLPEVVGNAAVLVNPHDYEEVAENIIKLQENEILKQTLVDNGRLNIKRFEWSETMNKYIDVIGAACFEKR